MKFECRSSFLRWLSLLLVSVSTPSAGVAVPKAVPPPALSQAQLSSFRGIQTVAQESCLSPALAGWSVAVSGSGQIKLNPPMLVKLLASAGVKLKAGVAYDRWSGLLQKDAGSAFASRNDCVARLFTAMVGALPRVDDQGKDLPKPAHPETIYKSFTETTTSTAQTQSNVGNVNGSGMQINNAGPSTNYNGPVSTGSGNAYLISTAPPVTEVEKQKAHDALLDELRQLATYPERDPGVPASTTVEGHMATVVPRALYLRLSHYYDGTVESVPSGSDLVAYEKSYYNYQISARDIERRLRVKIGALSTDNSPYVWNAYFDYCLVRAVGFSVDTIKAERGQIGFGTYEQAEKTYQALMADKGGAEDLTLLIESTNQITGAATTLVALYR